jgi:hypothetical protein
LRITNLNVKANELLDILYRDHGAMIPSQPQGCPAGATILFADSVGACTCGAIDKARSFPGTD